MASCQPTGQGIRRKIDPRENRQGPIDQDIFKVPARERDRIVPVPASLQEALEALRGDHEFLLEGGVFTEDLIETWIKNKFENEVMPVRDRPHPYEIHLYYDL